MAGLFRGAGDVMNTGRANAAKATKRLNETFDIGVGLVANPEQRIDPFISAMSLFLGNHEGWWTGRKLPNYAGYGNWDMLGALGVVNGADRFNDVGTFAGMFLKALMQAATPKVPVTPTVPDIITPLPIPTTELALENLRTWTPEALLLAKIGATDFLSIAHIIEQERLNPTTKAAISLPIIEETDMSFIKSKSIFKSKRIWGIAGVLITALFPVAQPIVDFVLPTITGATPEVLEQMKSNQVAAEDAIQKVLIAVNALWTPLWKPCR